MSELRDLDFERLSEILSSGSKEELYNFCIKFNLKIEDGKIYPTQRDECLDAIKYWDKKQLVTKINLNSLYGAILNPGCRFQDKRIGQSTTLTGRVIARHMDAHVNECITGRYDHVGDAIIYGDTDSVYFSAYPTLREEIDSGRMAWNKDICVELYDTIAASVNDSFPGFMDRALIARETWAVSLKADENLLPAKPYSLRRNAMLY